MICENDTAFDVFAEICSLLSKEDERKCDISWKTAKEEQIRNVIEKYDDFVKIVLNSSLNEYRFNTDEILVINSTLEELKKKTDAQDEIFRLAIEVEQKLDTYAGWLDNTVFHAIQPLNNNVDETKIEIYPYTEPFWDVQKSERNRAHILNTHFKNYMIVRKEDCRPFQLDVHYWDGRGLLDETGTDLKLSVALSPIMDYAKLDTSDSITKKGDTIIVHGLRNKQIVTQRVLDIFDELFTKKYSLIVFTECLGTRETVEEIKGRMRMWPEVCTFVILPTICENDKNTLIVLGPGGTECLRHHKATPFILIGKDKVSRREQLEYDNRIPVLITKELGMVVFPVCAEFLDPEYYKVMTEIAMATTVICPSFSPGIQAFIDTMKKGTPIKLLQLYINTCSAKEVSRKGTVAEPLGMVQLPYITLKGNEQKSSLIEMQKQCKDNCSDMLCYFDILISYNLNSQAFDIKTKHCVICK